MNLKDLIADVNVNEIYEHIETETLSEWVNAWQKAALSALRPVSREQVEKVFPGCEYCTNNIKSRKEYITKEYPGLCDFEVFLDGSRTPSDIAVITYNHQTPFTEDICFSFPVLYCPHCGRPLTDEAVDIRLKELEALNDAGNQ